jgi:hypothetical protein
MDTIRIKCAGVTDGPLYIPPFSLHQGEAICLRVPYPVGKAFEQRLANLLLGSRLVAGFSVHGQPQWVDPFLQDPRRMTIWSRFKSRWFVPRRTIDWARASANVSHDKAEALLTRLGLDPIARLDNLAATPKTLLGLACALENRANILLVSTAGLDPLGRNAVVEAASRHRDAVSLVYIAYPYWCQQQLCWDAIQGASNLTLEWHDRLDQPQLPREPVTHHAS